MIPRPPDAVTAFPLVLPDIFAHSRFLLHEARLDPPRQLRRDGVDVFHHVTDIAAFKFRCVVAIPLCNERPLHMLMGAVQRNDKVFPVALPGERLKPDVVIKRSLQRAVVLEPHIVVVQNEGIRDPQHNAGDFFQASGQGVVPAKPVIPAGLALHSTVPAAEIPGTEPLLPCPHTHLTHSVPLSGRRCSMRPAMEVNTPANSRDSLMVSSISSLVMRVHLTQIRTFSSVGVSRTAFS